MIETAIGNRALAVSRSASRDAASPPHTGFSTIHIDFTRTTGCEGAEGAAGQGGRVGRRGDDARHQLRVRFVHCAIRPIFVPVKRESPRE
eukprot:6208332-Prymnesium_polylepis.1